MVLLAHELLKARRLELLCSFLAELYAEGVAVSQVTEYVPGEDGKPTAKICYTQGEAQKVLEAVGSLKDDTKAFLTYVHPDFPDFDIEQQISFNGEVVYGYELEILGEYQYDYDKLPGDSTDSPYQPFMDKVNIANLKYDNLVANYMARG